LAKSHIAAAHERFNRVFSGSANVHPHLTHASLGPPESLPQTASRSVRPFLHRWPQRVPILYSGPPLPPQNCPFSLGSGPHLIHDPWAHTTPQPKQHLDLFSHFLQSSELWQTDRPTDSQCYSVC